MSRAFRIHAADNVATMLDQGSAGDAVEILGHTAGKVTALESIQLGHKIALVDIPKTTSVTKFGVSIGEASADIRQGQWIHLHNLRSHVDERSGTLDNQTGAPKDTAYL